MGTQQSVRRRPGLRACVGSVGAVALVASLGLSVAQWSDEVEITSEDGVTVGSFDLLIDGADSVNWAFEDATNFVPGLAQTSSHVLTNDSTVDASVTVDAFGFTDADQWDLELTVDGEPVLTGDPDHAGVEVGVLEAGESVPVQAELTLTDASLQDVVETPTVQFDAVQVVDDPDEEGPGDGSDAGTEGLEYSDNGDGTAEATGYHGTKPDVVIPSEVDLGDGPLEVTSIGGSAFAGTDMISVIIGESVTSIGDEAFWSSNLESVTILGPVTDIASSAFSNNNLTSVTIPDSVTSIGFGAFENNNLTSVTIPDSVTSIGLFAFVENKLESVVIPSSVASVGMSAFEGNELGSVTFEGPPPPAGNSNAFNGNPDVTIYYPHEYDASVYDGGFTEPTWEGYDSVRLPEGD